MHRLLPAVVETLAAAIALFPVFRYLNRKIFPDSRRTVLCFLFSLYLSCVYALAGLPNVLYVRFEANLNFTPFAYMFSDWDTTLLNVLMFVPLGFALPVLWGEYKTCWKTLLFGFMTSLLIEFLQLFTYRATDVNDLMTNTLGTLVGYCIAKMLLQLFPALPSGNRKELSVLCTVTFAALFFLQPFLSRLFWSFLI